MINTDIYRLDLKTPDAKPERFISSTRYEGEPVYSPDGKRIAFSSNRGGSRQIWVADADGLNPVSLTSFVDGAAGLPAWSPDGQFIVFQARPGGNLDIYTVPAAGGPVKRLTDYPGLDQYPSWSPDGKWIYFASNRAGQREIFRMKPDGSSVQQITHNEGLYGVVSRDGRWLYYYVYRNGFWKMPADGGAATQLLPQRSMPYGYSGASAQGIVFQGRPGPSGYPILLYPFDGGEVRTIATLASGSSPEISPDGRWLLFEKADDPIREIMLVDHFR